MHVRRFPARAVLTAAGTVFATLLLAGAPVRAQGDYGPPPTTSKAGQQREGTVQGRVRSGKGAPVAGVIVRLDQLERSGQAAPGAAIARADTTNADGRYVFAGVPNGSYVLTFERDSLTTRRTSVMVQGRPAAIDVVLTAPGEQVTQGATTELAPVVVQGREAKAPPTIGQLPDVRGTEIFAGKKTEVLVVDSLALNSSGDITRQLFSRVPGANISETQSSGFPSNGLGFRGLNPVQSVEMNVRQDGVNIVADLYGYPETYYTPPADALDNVELIRGSSSLQYGPQFGGVVDYDLHDGSPNSSPQFKARETGGSFGLFNSYLSVEGGKDKWTYFAYGQYRGQTGWRPNSELSQVSAAGKVTYRANDKLTLSVEYSLLRNRIHMPGGLDNAEFNEDARQSTRERNWLASPWNILAAKGAYEFSPSTKLTTTLSVMASQRYLVWRNEDGGPEAEDNIDPETLQFAARELEWEYFTNVTDETRLAHTYSLFGKTHTLATGFRVFGGDLHRQEGGPGSTGSDFNTNLIGGPYATDLKFGNANASAFAENLFQITPKLTFTPGVRVEFLHSTIRGYTEDTIATPASRNRTFALAGAGLQYAATGSSNVYANITQAYRPIEYSFLTPFASLTRIDPNLKDPKGFNADIGWRGSIGDVLRFDVGVFDLEYHNRIGLISGVDSLGQPFTERTNVANSSHKGVESYLDVSLTSLVNAPATFGTIDLFDALGYTHARYTSGEFDGNHVEFAPDVVNRTGIAYSRGKGTIGLQWSYVGKQFTDANNTVASFDADVGVVPAYNLFDLSGKYELSPKIGLDFGINNVTNRYYFTMRTTEYPGPGIIPGIGRSIYLGARVNF